MRAGDEVRLKFLYPNGDVEVVDCTWIAIASLTENGRESQTQWVVLEFDGREIWKPLSCLVQVEVLEENLSASLRSDAEAITDEGLGYHR